MVFFVESDGGNSDITTRYLTLTDVTILKPSFAVHGYTSAVAFPADVKKDDRQDALDLARFDADAYTIAYILLVRHGQW